MRILALVHSVPIEDDHILRFPVTGCRRYTDVHRELIDTPAMHKLDEEYRGNI